MSHLDKGLPLYRTFSTLPKEPQTALNNVSTSVEGDDTVFQSARAFTYPVAASTTLPPPPSASSHQDWAESESHSSQQAYDLHLHQFLHLNRASRPPPSAHSSRIVNEYNGYPKARGQAPCYQFNPGSRIAQDSQRTLVDTPRYSSVRSTGDSLSSKSPTDDPGGQEYKEQQNSRQRTAGGLDVTSKKDHPRHNDDHLRPSIFRSPLHSVLPNSRTPILVRSPEHPLRDQPGLPKTTKIRAKGPSSRMHHQHLSANGSSSAMLGCLSSPFEVPSSPLTPDLPDLNWAIANPSNQDGDSQRTVKDDPKAAAYGVVILQSLQQQRDTPLSVGEDDVVSTGQAVHKEHQQGQQHHQGDPFTASSSFTYMDANGQKSLSTTAIDAQHPSHPSSTFGVSTPPQFDNSSSNHSYTPLSQEDEEQLHEHLQTYLNNVGSWSSDHLSNPNEQQARNHLVAVKTEVPEPHLEMSPTAGTPQSQLAIPAPPARPVSTTPTVYSTGAASNHSQGQQSEGNQQGHLVPVTQVGNRFVHNPSRPTFAANGSATNSNQNGHPSSPSHPVSINQNLDRPDLRGGLRSAMPPYNYQYMNHDGDNGQHLTYQQNGQALVPMSAAPALGGGVTFLQLPGGAQQFYSYSQNGSPGIVVPTNMLQPGRAYANVEQDQGPHSSRQPYTPSGGSYHPHSASVAVPAGYPTNMFYHARSAGVEPPSAFQMVVSGSHDFFDQGALGHGRRPGMYQVKAEQMSDGMGDDDENDDTVGDYEQDRLRNIRRNQEMMEKLGLAGGPSGYGDHRSVSRSPLKTVKRKTSSMGMKGTMEHKHRFKSRVPSNIGPLRHSNRIASKQHRSVSYADQDRHGGMSDSDSEDVYSDAMEEDEDDWDEDDYRRAPRSRNRTVRRKLSFQQSGRARGSHGRQSRGYRPTLRELLSTHPRLREAFPLFYHILTDDMLINNESFPLIGSIPTTCAPVDKAKCLKEFYHKGRRCLAQLDAFTARCDKRYDGPGDKWKPLDHDTKIAIRDIRRKGVERCENYKYTRRDILNKTVGKNNWEAIEEGMITWNVNSESNDPANDLAGVELSSPVPSSPEPMQRRHASGRHRSGRYQHPDEYNGRGHGNITYAESSVAQPLPGSARSMQQHGGFSNERSGQYHSGHEQQYSVQQNGGTWQQVNPDGGFNVPTLPYASVSGGGQVSYNTSGNPIQQQYQHGTVGTQQNGNNQQTYANFNANTSANGPSSGQQVSHSDNGMTNGELSATSVHELHEQSMGMMHGGIDMDFQMADPSSQSAAPAP